MYLSAWQKRKFGNAVDIKILQAKINFRSYKEYEDLILKYNPALIGLRGLTVTSNQIHIAAKLARHNTKAIIIAGGPYPSSSPEKVVSDSDIDAVVIGEGEQTFEEVLKSLIEGSDKWMDVDGLCVMKEGK